MQQRQQLQGAIDLRGGRGHRRRLNRDSFRNGGNGLGRQQTLGGLGIEQDMQRQPQAAKQAYRHRYFPCVVESIGRGNNRMGRFPD
ncbi:hypothetical protein GCM10023095_09630 [Pseudaeromonas paramecii]|uniref:Uncharacterized protein n=1 Tax=Pseudaeromonas paramecii TaxID=2138166 RepID=A0ABP8Q0N7_9GAMM